MGEVWLAHQEHPVRRRVAIKVIKLGMDTRDVVARFAIERQAIALMEHPCIARMFDAGVTAEGRPFFVMEYVAGDPLHTYCDQAQLSIEQRLALFLLICEAVQHAHQKAIIHRDLKPSNILIATNNGRPEPKIIDFGIAKAVAGQISQQIVTTQYGAPIGTPEYMSPEQADGGIDDIDTRTDVYSLGVILYELLAGIHPLDLHSVKSLAEMRQRIRDVDPQPPSTGVRHSVAADDIARRRATSAARLPQFLKGDLNAITLKALEKDRNRRYRSPAELATDIERHLRHEPVVAHPPSLTYRLERFARRHRFGAAVGVIAAVVLITFTVGMAVLAAALARERDRVAQEAETRARVVSFLRDLFDSADPARARGSAVSARDLLDRGALRIAEIPDAQTDVRSELMETMGHAYEGLGVYADSERLYRQALAIREASDGLSARMTLNSASALGMLLGRLGRHQETIDLLQRALGAGAPPKEHDEIWNRAQMAVGIAHYRLGHFEQAEPILASLAADERKAHEGARAEKLSALNNLALLYGTMGRTAEAIALDEEVLAARRATLGETHPLTLMSMNNLAFGYSGAHRFSDARTLLNQALERSQSVLGPDHPAVGTMTHTLGEVELADSQFATAAQLLSRAQAIYRKQPSNQYLPMVAYELAQTFAEIGRTDEALAELRASLVAGYKPLIAPMSDPHFTSVRDKVVFKTIAGLSTK